jgi:cytochrome oxidase assembly protein ShyY1
MLRLPFVATLVVALAIAGMISLGIWQARKAPRKDALIARYHAAEKARPLYGLPADMSLDQLAFRHSYLICSITAASTQIGGADAKGKTGYRNIAGCKLNDGRVILVDLGWSPVGMHPVLPPVGQRIEGSGRLSPDVPLVSRVLGPAPGATPLLFILAGAVPGLEPSVPPSIDAIPNNHRSYAVQWFLFAAIALVIYLLALRKRIREGS